jgi:hypothetical protein
LPADRPVLGLFARRRLLIGTLSVRFPASRRLIETRS